MGLTGMLELTAGVTFNATANSKTASLTGPGGSNIGTIYNSSSSSNKNDWGKWLIQNQNYAKSQICFNTTIGAPTGTSQLTSFDTTTTGSYGTQVNMATATDYMVFQTLSITLTRNAA
jgi:hypothetical protein